jgi:hypothetical protein
VELCEQRIKEQFAHSSRFIPFLSLHEFEALVFSSPQIVAEHFGIPALAEVLKGVVGYTGSPELLNTAHDKHPKRQLEDKLKEQDDIYTPLKDGPTILEKIGLPAIRSACRHFDRWLGQLERLGGLGA